MKLRNTPFMVNESSDNYAAAVANSLMQVTVTKRKGKQVTLSNGQEVTEFINCSYLGLDLHPKVVNAFHKVDPSWGVNFCCARSRFTMEPLTRLEEELSLFFGARAVTFPSVTTTHIAAMPLVASGVLIDDRFPPKVRLIFDRFAHSSMQFLKPVLKEECGIETISHNSLEELRIHVLCAKSRGEVPIYVADGIYSMGGVCPITELLEMAEELDFYLYIDDAHGTSIFGEKGEGPVLAQMEGFSDRLFLTFSMTKGFGAAGGGILLSDKRRESTLRTFGQIYGFSAPLDFASVEACLEALELHRNGTVRKLQQNLLKNVAFFDDLMQVNEPFSPIRMVKVGDEEKAISVCRQVLEAGYFVSVAFFPIVPRGQAQLRICLSSDHTTAEIAGLVDAIQKALPVEDQKFVKMVPGTRVSPLTVIA